MRRRRPPTLTEAFSIASSQAFIDETAAFIDLVLDRGPQSLPARRRRSARCASRSPARGPGASDDRSISRRLPALPEIGIGLLGVGWMGAAAYRLLPPGPRPLPGLPGFAAAGDRGRRLGRAGSRGDATNSATRAGRRTGGRCSPIRMWTRSASPRRTSCTAEMALAAAEAGKHIWVEKPLGRFPAETVRAVDGVSRRRRPEQSSDSTTATCRPSSTRVSSIASGQIGAVNHYRSQFLASYASQPQGGLSWRFSRELAGYGILYDLMSHEVDMAQFLLGPIGRVTGALVDDDPAAAADRDGDGHALHGRRRCRARARSRTRTGLPR